MAPWLAFVEAYLTQALLRTPAFHRAVEKVAKSVHRIRHGIPPEEMGGTKIDQPQNSSFLRHFTDEIQVQLGRAEGKTADAALKSQQGVAGESAASGASKEASSGGGSAEAAWENARRAQPEGPKQSFLGEYTNALREQMRGAK